MEQNPSIIFDSDSLIFGLKIKFIKAVCKKTFHQI